MHTFASIPSRIFFFFLSTYVPAAMDRPRLIFYFLLVFCLLFCFLVVFCACSLPLPPTGWASALSALFTTLDRAERSNFIIWFPIDTGGNIYRHAAGWQLFTPYLPKALLAPTPISHTKSRASFCYSLPNIRTVTYHSIPNPTQLFESELTHNQASL